MEERQTATQALSDPAPGTTDLSGLWAFGLISARTGEPLIFEGGEHQLDTSLISYGFNQVTDSNGTVQAAAAAPFSGGEQLVLLTTPLTDTNTIEYARTLAIMAPIRDAILYQYEQTTRVEWEVLTSVLTLNGLKTTAATSSSATLLSAREVYDYVATGPTDGNPVLQFLEEAELELKCLGFTNFNFTNPEGTNHCEETGLTQGAGIRTSAVLDNGVDEVFYLRENADLAAAGLDGPNHYAAHGWREGRDPNGWFDTDWYLQQNADVAAANLNPLEHYLAHGWSEGRNPSEHFDGAAYLQKNTDVALAGLDPLSHWLSFGIAEGRDWILG
ncbi:hypothetical protein [Roseibium sp.]|uniref:hypothetical protein n=1 Tax=Roseibium sp. TaxID=1936156 RepID=UPI003B52060A